MILTRLAEDEDTAAMTLAQRWLVYLPEPAKEALRRSLKDLRIGSGD